MNLMIDSVFVMLVCFVLGALMAWLLAAAMYPTRKDLREQADEHVDAPGVASTNATAPATARGEH